MTTSPNDMTPETHEIRIKLRHRIQADLPTILSFVRCPDGTFLDNTTIWDGDWNVIFDNTALTSPNDD